MNQRSNPVFSAAERGLLNQLAELARWTDWKQGSLTGMTVNLKPPDARLRTLYSF